MEHPRFAIMVMHAARARRVTQAAVRMNSHLAVAGESYQFHIEPSSNRFTGSALGL